MAFSFLAAVLSCTRFFESVGDRLHRDNPGWFEIREMKIYCNGPNGLAGITIFPDQKGEGRYKICSGSQFMQKGPLTEVDVSPLKDSLYMRSISSWIFEKNTHCRDHMMIHVDPDKWKKRRVCSLHYAR